MKRNAVDGIPVRFQRIPGRVCRKPRSRILVTFEEGGGCCAIDLGLQSRFLGLEVQNLRRER